MVGWASVSELTLVIVGVVVLVAATTQRATGMGFALVAAPFLVILLGPVVGVILVNFASIISALAILMRLRSDIEWRRYAWIALPALVGIVPGSLLALALPTEVLELTIGGLLIVALAIAVWFRRAGAEVVTWAGAPVLAGAISGATNAAAGIGGPPISIYAALSDWEHRSFVATVQPYFATIGLASLVTKLAIDPTRWPQLDWWVWLVGAVAIVVGLLVGDRIARHISPTVGRRVVLLIAALGAVSLCVRAGITLATGY